MTFDKITNAALAKVVLAVFAERVRPYIARPRHIELGDGHLALRLHVDIDPATELARLDKERARLQAEIGKAQGKLNNAAFVAKAPESVLAQERDRLTEYSDKLTKIKMQLAALDLGMAASELLPGSPSVKRAEIAEIGSPPHM